MVGWYITICTWWGLESGELYEGSHQDYQNTPWARNVFCNGFQTESSAIDLQCEGNSSSLEWQSPWFRRDEYIHRCGSWVFRSLSRRLMRNYLSGGRRDWSWTQLEGCKLLGLSIELYSHIIYLWCKHLDERYHLTHRPPCYKDSCTIGNPEKLAPSETPKSHQSYIHIQN